ncbi:alpha/beta hydrolase [Nitratireductor sp. XY-223]|uniref:alpha/beta hydrolase n=1 Tax=Nitratireductor sp. XY-223 TaxID=2561926 RepID=UPI00145B0D5E|nr:alpha/beta hydrolase [Nitratireductor sp. XY-223]
MFKIAIALAGVYAAIVVAAYFLQTQLIFPAGLVGRSAPPPGGRNVELTTSDGETVVLIRLSPVGAETGERPVLLGFGGNAWSADAVAELLHRIFPEYEIAAMHYRGYGPSSGRPSAKALFEDAALAFDHLSRQSQAGVVAVGFSIGASVAVDLAASRPLKGLVLATPFDSLKELAATHYPWLPVRLLLRHRMESAATLRALTLPVAIITADNDTVVPAPRSKPVREAAADLRADTVIAGAGHNDIYERAEFVAALRQSVEAVSND